MIDHEGYKQIIFPGELLKPTTKRSVAYAWMFLYLHRNRRTGACFPSIKRIASLIGCDRRTARSAVAELESLGLIQRNARIGSSTEYIIDLPNFKKEKKNRHKKGMGSQNPPGASKSPRGGASESHPPDLSIPGVGSQNPPLYNVINEKTLTLSNLTISKKGKSKTDSTLKPARVMELYNEHFHSVKKLKSRPCKRGSKTQTWRQLKARIKERPTEEMCIQAFQRAAKSPWCLGRVPKAPNGMDIDNMVVPGFLDKLDEGKYDARTNGVDFSNDFQEQARLNSVLGLIRVRTRMALNEKMEKGETQIKDWWEKWRERLVLELRAEDAILVEGRAVEHALAYWKKLITEKRDEQRNGDHKVVENVQSESGRSNADQLSRGVFDLFE